MSRFKDGFDPIETARTIEESYRGYIATTIHFANTDLQAKLESILAEPAYLARGPFLEAAPPYMGKATPRELVDAGELCPSMLRLGNGNVEHFDPDRKLYEHQVRALGLARAGRNYIVTTGTGSGKTECFLLPILDDILREFEESGFKPGVRAMVIYPMNALANDQLKRLRKLLEGLPITFGRYTGDTAKTQSEAEKRWAEENADSDQERLPNELISREEMRKTPPNILLTNYSMLEYLLLRPEDAPFFSKEAGGAWRHIAIDEAHMYSGALGTEIAYLLRRLKARIGIGAGTGQPLHCYATSATMGSKDDLAKIAQFAADLFGEPFATEGDVDVIVGTPDSPVKDLRPVWGTLPLDVWGGLRDLLDAEPVDAAALGAFLDGYLPRAEYEMLKDAPTPALGLGRVLLGEGSTDKLVRRMAVDLLDLTPQDGTDAIAGLGIEGLDARTLTNMVEVLSAAQRSEGVPVLSSRYHSFLRGPEGLFYTPHTRELGKEKLVNTAVAGVDKPVPVYEIAACRHCGEAYLLGTEEAAQDNACSWLNPKPKDEDLSDAERFDPRVYYRLLEDSQDIVDAEQLLWICPTCGSLHAEQHGGGHVFAHPPVERIPIAQGKADEECSKCPHCGYTSVNAIQPMRVSPEAVGSVVCYDLVREVPAFKKPKSSTAASGGLFARQLAAHEAAVPQAGSVICFSDKRQDAAYFAPAMERTYNDLTIRQIIREAVGELYDGRHGVLPSDVCDWIANEGAQRYGLLFSGSSARNIALSWMLGEMMSDAPRNNLEALGVVRFEPTVFVEQLNAVGPDVARSQIEEMDKSLAAWLTVEDYLLFVRYCLESLRKSGAIKVPLGVDTLLKKRTRVSPVYVYPRVDSSSKDAYSFIGNEKGAENGRSAFIRKYAREKHGVELTRSDATALLARIHQFLADFLLYLAEKDKSQMIWNGNGQKFRLEMDLWQLYPYRDDDPVYLCDMCGCEYHWDLDGICPTFRCSGHLHQTTFAGAQGKDAHYKDEFRDTPVPLRIEEHTAQLSTQRARDVQRDFIKGDVNVLSCTTTFELGVDVGDLRAVFMRNVPPKTANYTQRAGRVGRRAGKPGFAVTFARLRPHDVALFKNPERIVRGITPPPCCYLGNEAIALRHVFAVVLSEYFRYRSEKDAGDIARKYNDFLDLSTNEPEGMTELREYLAGHPASIAGQLDEVFPVGAPMREKLGIDEWAWVDKLVGPGTGRLVHAHESKSEDFQRIADARERYQAEGEDNKAGSMSKIMGGLKKQQTIQVLAENGVLPKYGFPTDLVELHVPIQEQSIEEKALRLQRGLRQAIQEYAPGNEIIADKRVWKSTGIRRPRERKLEVRSFGKCPECETFAWPIDDLSGSVECKICRATVPLTCKMLIPSEGFDAELVDDKDPGSKRPRSKGGVRIEYCQHCEEEARKDDVVFSGGRIKIKYATNGQLCAMNTGGRAGFIYCPYCGAAAPGTAKDPGHKSWCIDKRSVRYQALGAAFTSDILEFRFEMDGRCSAASEDWESLSWALYSSASNLLEIPESEIGATFYPNDSGAFSILLYDNVPGGAGHTLQLAERAAEIVQGAYDVVANCTCGEDTCCYGCLSNYFNQGRQGVLTRGGALGILRALGLGGEEAVVTTPGDDAVGTKAEKVAAVVGGPEAQGRSGIPGPWLSLLTEEYALDMALDETTVAFMRDLACLEVPVPDVVGYETDDGMIAELAWESPRVCYVAPEFISDRPAFQKQGWTVFTDGDDVNAVAAAIREG